MTPWERDALLDARDDARSEPDEYEQASDDEPDEDARDAQD